MRFTTNGDNSGQFNSVTNSFPTDNNHFEIVNDSQPTLSDDVSLTSYVTNDDEQYNSSQYSKLFTRPYLNYQLITQDGNSMVIDQVGLGNLSNLTLTKKNSFQFESNSSKLIISNGMYFDDLRSPYTLEVNGNISYFQSTNE